MLHFSNMIVVVFTFDLSGGIIEKCPMFALGIVAASFCDKSQVLINNYNFLEQKIQRIARPLGNAQKKLVVMN